ncbi:MAG TPA: hypothetical protein VFE55_14275 [Acidimicrobiia bacterium]|nr:hypothetical protein [Acidimicrobiia bacterium]
MRRNILGLAAALTLISALAPLLASAAPAAAEETTGYIATASAQGFRSTYVVPGQFVVEQIWDYGGPVAQGRVDTSGGSAYASLPFPGQTAIVAPNFPNIVGLPVLPVSYPFYVSASYPATPSGQMADPSGNYDLAASAGAASSKAEAFARGGPDAGRLFRTEARTNITQSGDTVVAHAESVMEGLSFGGGLLTIGSAVARSTTTMTPGAPLQRSGQLNIDGVKVARQAVGVGANGVDDKVLNDVLKNAGLSVHIDHQAANPNGASADVLEITVSHPLPEGTSNGVLRYRFGGASTSIVIGAPEGSGSSGTSAGDAPTSAQPTPVAVLPMLPIAATSKQGSNQPASYRAPYGLIAFGGLILVSAGAAWLRRAGRSSWSTS